LLHENFSVNRLKFFCAKFIKLCLVNKAETSVNHFFSFNKPPEMKGKSVFSIAAFFIFSQILTAQSYDIFAVAGNNLLKVDPLDATVEESFPINDLSEGQTIRSLTYSTTDGNMYGLVNLTTIPALVRLETDGAMTIVGNLTVPNETVFLAEALAYNETDNKLYGAVSLNGGTAGGDFFSETIIEIDPATAQSGIVTQLAFPSGAPDVDNMTFDENVLIIHDGLPGDDLNNFYLVDFQNIGGTAQATPGFSTSPYSPVGDLEKLNCSNTLVIAQEFDILLLDIDLQEITLIGSTHDMDQFEGASLLALTDVPNDETIALSITGDSTACTGEVLTLTAADPELVVNWNTGEVSPSIQVEQTGSYSGTVQVNACEVPTDSLNITFENCQDCDTLRSTIAGSLLLGSDTTLCQNEILSLMIDVEGSSVRWNTGATDPTLEVSRDGQYWAEVSLEDCTFLTDTIAVSFRNCDGCQALEMELGNNLTLGNDTIICINDTLLLSVDISGAEIEWNTGLVSSAIEISVPGSYWAEVGIGGCLFQTDTLRVAVQECLNCSVYIPNAFSPNGDDVNDNFMVFVDESLCRLREIEMLIFDRWGGLVFQGNQNRWNGKIKNEIGDNGTYVYLINMTLERDGQTIELRESGDVLLLKEN